MIWLQKILDEGLEFIGSVVLFALILGFGYMITHIKNSVEKRYGFLTMTPDMQWFPCHIEPIMIRNIEPGGAFDQAGFKDKDIMYLPQIHSVNGFHKLLKKPKGTSLEFYIIPFDRYNTDCESENRGKPEKKIVVAP